MISAVDIVIDEHLPVAIQGVLTRFEKVQCPDPKRCDLRDHAPQVLVQASLWRLERDENKLLPAIDRNRNQSIPCTIEIAHPSKIWSSLQAAIQTVAPSVVRTAEQLHRPAGL